MTLVEGFILLFVGLKLAGVIDWAWWLVLIPAYVKVLLYIIGTMDS